MPSWLIWGLSALGHGRIQESERRSKPTLDRHLQMETRRLHVSGLTPAINEKDLETRFSAFGTVKAVDGVGALDGVGQPRKFGYVSLNATPEKLAKCRCFVPLVPLLLMPSHRSKCLVGHNLEGSEASHR